MRFYTYIHASPEGDVFYVGKGVNNRVYSMSDRSWIWRERFNKYDGILMKIIARFETEQEAFEHERHLISEYRNKGFELVNLTEGGRGANGYKQSEALRIARSEKMRGYKYEIVTCPNCGEAGGKTSMMRWHFDKCTGPSKKHKARVTVDGVRVEIGRYATKAEAEAAVSEYYKANPKNNHWIGRKHTEEARQKMSASQTGHAGRKWTEEEKKSLSDKRRGSKNPFFNREHTDKAKASIGAKGVGRHGYWLGKSFSDEHRAKLKAEHICPHCGKEGSGSAMNRWHMDNCKFKAEAA